jgi:hypothetical protein
MVNIWVNKAMVATETVKSCFLELGAVAHTYDPRTPEVEVGGS